MGFTAYFIIFHFFQVRLTASDMSAFASFESSLNSQYGSDIVTEWPFNGLGILEVVSERVSEGVGHARSYPACGPPWPWPQMFGALLLLLLLQTVLSYFITTAVCFSSG